MVAGIKGTTQKIAEGGKNVATQMADKGKSVGRAVVSPMAKVLHPTTTTTTAEPQSPTPAAVTTRKVDDGDVEPRTPVVHKGSDDVDVTMTMMKTAVESQGQKPNHPESLDPPAPSVDPNMTDQGENASQRGRLNLVDTMKQGGEAVVDGMMQGGSTIVGGIYTVGKTMTSKIETVVRPPPSRGTAAGTEEPQDETILPGTLLLPPIPPDDTLKTMDVIITKRLKGLTVQQFHDIVWKEDPEKPLYRKWLESSGKNDIDIEDWQMGDTKGVWDGEAYQKQRAVTFRFTRTTHLYTGPPIATVKHKQFCRVEDEGKCVMAMQIEMEGIPFSDCFNVQIRWVVTRLGTDDDLKIQVGLFVNFIKHTV